MLTNVSLDLSGLPGDSGQWEALRDVFLGRRGAEHQGLQVLRWLGG